MFLVLHQSITDNAVIYDMFAKIDITGQPIFFFRSMFDFFFLDTMNMYFLIKMFSLNPVP